MIQKTAYRIFSHLLIIT